MTATIIILPIIAKPTAVGDIDAVTLRLSLPRRPYGHLLKLARQWNISIEAAAAMLLTDAVNAASGVKRK